MTTVLNLRRASYLKVSETNSSSLNYLSAKYLNMRFVIPSQRNYVITQADECNAPGIAFSFYGDRDYWWIILLFNGIVDPLNDFTPGRVLQLPSLSDVNAFLSLSGSDAENLDVTI